MTSENLRTIFTDLVTPFKAKVQEQTQRLDEMRPQIEKGLESAYEYYKEWEISEEIDYKPFLSRNRQ